MGKITEKSTKAQIMDAYTQALAELEKLKAMSDSPVENAKKEALEQIADAKKEANDFRGEAEVWKQEAEDQHLAVESSQNRFFAGQAGDSQTTA